MTAAATGCKSDFARSGLLLLALIALVADLGCAQFKSRRQAAATKSAELGSELPTRDIYAKNIKPTPISARSETPEPTEFPEAELAGDLLPSPAADDSQPSATEPGVTLQPPVTVDSSKVGAMSTNVGVPDGARLIAASNPRSRPGPARPPTDKASTRLVTAARQSLDSMATYQLSLRRQERVGNMLLPQEDLLMSIRRSPKAARLTWVDGPHRGREVLYQADEPGGLMHVNMVDSKIPMPRLSLAPDSPMVMKNSRHPITEAGLDPLIESMEQADAAGELIDLGMQTPAPLDSPHHGVLRRTAAGEVWRAYFDPTNHLPTFVECRSTAGDLLESYWFQNIQPNLPELASANAFDPNARWGPPRGLFGRASTRTAEGESPTTTR